MQSDKKLILDDLEVHMRLKMRSPREIHRMDLGCM